MEPSPPTAGSEPPMKLTDLSADALSHCASFLSERDVSSLAMTCKPLSRIAYSDCIWRRLFSERWPFQCISCEHGVREIYLNRHIALNQLRFHDPKKIFTSQHNIPHSHILLNKSEAFLAQGSLVHQMIIKSAEDGLFGPNPQSGDNILLGHNARITCMRSLPVVETFLSRNEMQNEENVLVTSSSDRTIRLWWKGRSRRCFKRHNGPVTTLADKLLGNCGTKVLASGGEDCTVRLWSVCLTGKRHPLTMTYHGHEKPVLSLSVASHKASLLVSMSTDSRVRVWDASSPSSSSSSSCVGMTCVSGPPVGIRCHDTQCYIASGSSVTAVDLRTMQKVSTIAVLLPRIYSFEMLSSKWLICTGGDDKALLWDIRKNQAKPEPVAELEPHVGRVTMLHMDPYKIVTGGPSDYNVNVWETSTGNLVNRLDCRIPGENEDVPGLSAMAVEGCRIITSGCTYEPGVSYFRDFTNCSVPISSLDCSSDSKFWDSQLPSVA